MFHVEHSLLDKRSTLTIKNTRPNVPRGTFKHRTSTQMHIGLYFGSFNPIHMGHLLISSFIKEEANLDEVRLIISPLNPFKEAEGMLPHHDRMLLAKSALLDHPKISASDLEFELPIPSYTIDSVKVLQEKEPDSRFSLIMGEDNLEKFHLWKEQEDLLNRLENVFVYPRHKYEGKKYEGKGSILEVNAPIIDISSTKIRNRIANQKSISFWVHPSVEAQIYKRDYYNIAVNQL